MTSQVARGVKNLPDNAKDKRDANSIPGSGKSPGGGHGNPLYSCLENPMNRGAWQATVYRVSKSWTQLKWLSTHAHTVRHKTLWYALLMAHHVPSSLSTSVDATHFVFLGSIYGITANSQDSTHSPLFSLWFFSWKISRTMASTATYVLINLNPIILSTYLSPEF